MSKENYFGSRSMSHFVTLHPVLQWGLNTVLVYQNFSIVGSLRPEKKQNIMYESGNSKLRFPNSSHNFSRDPNLPLELKWKTSDGVDVIPYPGGYNDIPSLLVLVGRLIQTLENAGYEAVWGGDWNRDGVLNNKKGEFFDGFHINLIFRDANGLII